MFEKEPLFVSVVLVVLVELFVSVVLVLFELVVIFELVWLFSPSFFSSSTGSLFAISSLLFSSSSFLSVPELCWLSFDSSPSCSTLFFSTPLEDEGSSEFSSLPIFSVSVRCLKKVD